MWVGAGESIDRKKRVEKMGKSGGWGGKVDEGPPGYAQGVTGQKPTPVCPSPHTLRPTLTYPPSQYPLSTHLARPSPTPPPPTLRLPHLSSSCVSRQTNLDAELSSERLVFLP